MTDKRRFGLSLGTRIFLITASLVALAVGAAVVLTVTLSSTIARRAVDQALDRAAVAQENLQRQNQQELKRLISAFRDQALVAYVAEGLANADRESIEDQLRTRQNDFGFDFAVVLDRDGRRFTSVPPGATGGDEMARRPLVARAMQRQQPEVGLWADEGKLYNVTVVPMETGTGIEGYLVAGFEIDYNAARDLAKASGAEVAYLAMTPNGPQEATATLGSNAIRDLLTAVRSGRGQAALGAGKEGGKFEVKLSGEPWVARLTPLHDPNGGPVGATVALASLNQQLEPFRKIQWVLLVAGLLALVAASMLSYALSRRTMGPVRRLAASAEAARQGDYNQRVKVERSDEVGQLAASFNQLLSDLREKRDMETYLGDLSRTLPEPGKAAPAAVAPQLKNVTVLAAELRRFARKEASSDPEQTMRRLARDLRRAETAVSARHGKLQPPLGHRLVATFDGDGKSGRALAAAAEIVAAVGAPEDAFDEPAEPLVALAAGTVTMGSVSHQDSPTAALLGLPVQKLESLMREATPGELVLSREVHEELAPMLSAAGIQASSQRGVVNPMPYFVVRGEDAARLTGVDPAAAAAPTRVTTGSAMLAELGPGKLLGSRFEILSQLGSGGMGIVYKARDRELDDLVALKVLRKSAWEDPVQLERLKDELRLARKITHPNVLRTFDFGELDGVQFISMEYVRGVTLRYMLDQTDRLPFSAGLRVAKQLCAGLAAAHGQGVIHRDIKPDNLILDQAGNAKLMDFGIARPAVRQTAGHTQQGWIVGTPQFMAPEQLEGREVDARADIYSTGVVLYEIFTGRLPFSGDNPMQVVMQHLQDEPPAPSGFWPEMPQHLERLILVCLAKKPDNRFSKVDALAAELDKLSA